MKTYLRLNYFFFLLILLAFSVPVIIAGESPGREPEGKVPGDAAIKWMSFEEAVQKSKKNPKKIFMDVYTGWCGWCKVMDKQTFTDPVIIQYINEKYYAVKLDAEMRDTVVFKNKKYVFVPQGSRGYHELATSFGVRSYPTIVFLDEQQNMIQAIPGFRRPPELDIILKYFGDNYYRNTDYQTFSDNYVSPYAEDGK